MTDRDDTLPGGWEAAAAEYVLGLLSPQEQSAFEAQLATDPDLQQDVEAWQTYFATLTDPIPEVAPPPQVKRRIQSALFGAQKRSIWRAVLPYGLGAVAAAGLAWVAFTGGLLTTGPEPLTARLAPVEDSTLSLLASFDPASGALGIEQLSGAVPADRVLELWLIAEGATAPVSLGLLPPEGGTVIALPPALAAQVAGATLAVSEEPPGGSPTGAPTGPVRAAGQVETL